MNYRKKILFILLISAPFYLSGCSLLLLPVQLVYFVVGGMFSVLSGAIPVAMKLLPLLLFLAYLPPEDGQENTAIVKNNNSPVITEDYIKRIKISDKSSLLEDKVFALLDKKTVQQNKKGRCVIFAFDTDTTPQEIAKKINSSLKNQKIDKIAGYKINGAAFFNDKYRFFVSLDKLTQKGSRIEGSGIFKELIDFYYSSSKTKA